MWYDITFGPLFLEARASLDLAMSVTQSAVRPFLDTSVSACWRVSYAAEENLRGMTERMKERLKERQRLGLFTIRSLLTGGDVFLSRKC